MTAMEPDGTTRSQEAMAGYARYLPVERDALGWGLHVIDVGYTEVPAGSPYPPVRHPDRYMFTWQRGRELNEYQLVYITRGRGRFECHTAAPVEIRAGDLFLLFPGAWHRYRPDSATGWDENWIGFSGLYAAQLMQGFFPESRPVLRVGLDPELRRLIRSTTHLMQSAELGYAQMMAGNTVAALARARGLAMRGHAPTDHHGRTMQEARSILLEQVADEVDLPALARRLGYSYSHFRTVFRSQTGMSPRQFQIQIRINLAKDLLTGSTQPISEIAEQLGFCSVYYFSRLFKQKTGLTPTGYRAGSPRFS